MLSTCLTYFTFLFKLSTYLTHYIFLFKRRLDRLKEEYLEIILSQFLSDAYKIFWCTETNPLGARVSFFFFTLIQ